MNLEQERRRMDESLRAERRRTDESITVDVRAAKGTASAAVEQCRKAADEVVKHDRGVADEHMHEGGESETVLRALERERSVADRALRLEREHADEALELERQERGRAEESAFATERGRTDRDLKAERWASDELVTQNRELLALLVSSVTEYAIFALDTTGTIISWNAGAERLKGYRADEIIGKNFAIFYPREDADAGVPEKALRTAAREGRFEGEGVRIRKDGGRFVANVVITALRDSRGTLRGFGKVTRDVTEHATRAEVALRVNEERLRLAIEAGDLGTWDWNLATNEMTWSDRLSAMFGLPPNTVLSFDRGIEAVHPEDREEVARRIRAALDPDGKGEYVNVFRAVWPDGTIRWLLARGRVSFMEVAGARRAMRFPGTIIDITARKTAEDERERLVHDLDLAVKARDDFVAVLSHDLRNPIGAIAMGASLLARQLPDGMDAQRKRADALRRQAELAGRMIDELLEEIALERGAVPFSTEPIDVRDLAADVRDMFHSLAEERGISLTVDCCGGLDRPVRANRDYVLRAIGNIVGNAGKFTPPGGAIAIRFEPEGDALKISVTDTGPGIPAEQLDRVFERGYRAGQPGSGLGLGLAIVKGIAEAHGGTTAVESEMGKGTTFWFTLPMV